MSGQSPFLYYFVRIVTWWLTKSLLGNDLKHVSTATYTTIEEIVGNDVFYAVHAG
jgi:hypothetical protein